ncbi:VOC family protein [Archangium lansingense]|uniref:Glyoxalase/bleomycin resistance/extradiol dioxygenase family protein n=1 Tax=Archangium lansingense TaxID=2995310 RepID=A0ABT4A226_9BACT|nr:glyoxalase/bleomycin resistance/extradiol dioxygenase family protein [Archangium lansinium]MCY1075707.1 glyoxalase/bleomycin resistance/extradiol dioxygenase family protein [Archangium lansinium]
MRFLMITISKVMNLPPDPAHMAKVRAAIQESIANGSLVATGPLGKRATAGARITQEGGKISVEDPPSGGGWMAGGGYSLLDLPSKAEAIAHARSVLETMGDGVIELIQVMEMYPPPSRQAQTAQGASTPGVIPYLTIEDAAEAATFYQKAFGARELGRMLAQDGKRVMHCHLEINAGGLMLSDHFPEMGLPSLQRSDSYTMQLVVEDGDRWWRRAIEAGCTEKMPFAVAPWGDKYGQLKDPFGVTWAISSPAKR